MMDEDEIVYARIRANVEMNKRLESFYPSSGPKEIVMSMETVMAQRKKIDEICAHMRAREASMTREVSDG